MPEKKILFLESFYDGSHRYFADAVRRYSRHTVDLCTLPARHWKWRMRSSAFEFFRRIPDPSDYDLVFTSGLINLAELKGLWNSGLRREDSSGESSSGGREKISAIGQTKPLAGFIPPVVLYMHENQLDYPLSPGEKRDFHYGFTDLANCLAADLIVFNSKKHRDSFLNELPVFLGRFPDYRPLWSVGAIAEKSTVLYPGVDPPETPFEQFSPPPSGSGVLPLIVWNHRWEHDKGPEDFFEVLFEIDKEGLPFSLAVLGEQYTKAPDIFGTAGDRLDRRIVHWGFIEERKAYLDILSRASIVISTALQENFGISVVEAVRAGCRPLLPNRLSYPELIPPPFHDRVLYNGEMGQKDLYDRLSSLLRNPESIPLPDLSSAMGKFDWSRRIEDYDRLFERFW